MKYFILLSMIILSSYAYAEALEFKPEVPVPICKEMVGIWFTDTTVINTHYGEKRDIIRIDRNTKGSAYLKGVSIYYDENEIQTWEFSSSWSCNGKWYSEQNEWGVTKFKIRAFKDDVTVLYDEENNMGAPEPIEIFEKRKLDNLPEQPLSNNIKEFLGI